MGCGMSRGCFTKLCTCTGGRKGYARAGEPGASGQSRGVRVVSACLLPPKPLLLQGSTSLFLHELRK